MHLRNENREIKNKKNKSLILTTTKFGLEYQISRHIVIGIIKHETTCCILFSLNTWYYFVTRDGC